MNKFIIYVVIISSAFILTSCSGSPYRHADEGELIESRYAIFQVHDTSWMVAKNRTTTSANSGISSSRPGVTYDIEVANYTLPDNPTLFYFDKNADYLQILRDEDMNLNDNDREQGIGYVRQWTRYVLGMKCGEGVFSRNGGGMIASINSKDYGISCGYYHKNEGKRLLSINYRYHYAGSEIRHDKDKDTPRKDLLTLEQAELQLKQAVKAVIATLQIKDIDWAKMQQEGLLHPDTKYELSPY